VEAIELSVVFGVADHGLYGLFRVRRQLRLMALLESELSV